MFAFASKEKPAPKCFFTHCSLPDYVNDKRSPEKQKPFSTINSLRFPHRVNLILPEELYDVIQQTLQHERFSLHYARINMSLLEILSGDFFNHYIKSGNILMRSQGRDGIDHLFTLHEGILRIEVDHSTYERCGIVGKPIQSGGRKHVKSRWRIEQDLRLPSIVSGKPGFDRLKRACKTVLSAHVSWLFIDINARGVFEGPVLAFHPKVFSVKPEVSKTDKVIIPPLDGDEGDGYLHDADYEEQLLDWLGMVILNSPRILDYDEVDPYLSLWRPPNAADASKSSETKSVTTDTLVTMQWQGLASASFIRHLLLAIRKVIGHSWFAISASAFNGHSYMLLLNGSRKALMWEIPADM